MPGQQQLIVQVVLEPEHEFVVVAIAVDRRIGAFVTTEDVTKRAVPGRAQVPGPDLPPAVAVFGGHGPLVEHVGPDDHVAGQARAAGATRLRCRRW